jgi:hypothetical protein
VGYIVKTLSGKKEGRREGGREGGTKEGRKESMKEGRKEKKWTEQMYSTWVRHGSATVSMA